MKVLDCTLRDGGQGLEYLNYEAGIKTKEFSLENRENIAMNIRNSEVDIIELGAMAANSDDRSRFAIYQDIEELSKYIPERVIRDQMFVGLYVGPDTDIDKIPDASSSLIDGVRVILRYSELKKSLDYCAALSKKGYKVFLQPMLTMRYTEDDLKRVIYSANEMNAFALYFVDSFGYMSEADVARFCDSYEVGLNEDIHIGFHAHNHMDMAFCNSKFFIERFMGRKKILDSCVMGMGQGAGNLPTELLLYYLNKFHGTEYKLKHIWKVCDVLEKFREHDMEVWGYSPLWLIPAMHNAAYKYAMAMKKQYKMSYAEINSALEKISDDIKHRYTPSDLEKLLRH